MKVGHKRREGELIENFVVVSWGAGAATEGVIELEQEPGDSDGGRQDQIDLGDAFGLSEFGRHDECESKLLDFFDEGCDSTDTQF